MYIECIMNDKYAYIWNVLCMVNTHIYIECIMNDKYACKMIWKSEFVAKTQFLSNFPIEVKRCKLVLT